MQEYSRTATDADWSQLVGSDDSCTETGERNTPPLCGDAEYLRSSTGGFPYRLCCLYGIIYHTFIQSDSLRGAACRKISLKNYIMYLGTKWMYCIMNTCCIISSFPQNAKCHFYHNFTFSCSKNMFFINHTLNFKYLPW